MRMTCACYSLILTPMRCAACCSATRAKKCLMAGKRAPWVDSGSVTRVGFAADTAHKGLAAEGNAGAEVPRTTHTTLHRIPAL